MYLDRFTNDYAKMCMAAYCADFDIFMSYYDVDKLVELEYELDNYQKDGYATEYPELGDGELPDDYGFDSWEEPPNWSDKLELAVRYITGGGDYNPDKLNSLHLLTYILAYTCRNNFIFAYQLRHSGLELNEMVNQAISASFIQNGYLDDYFIKVYKPVCIWYPNHPSKETCLKLLKVHDFYMYSVAYLACIVGWEDIFDKCNIHCGFIDMHALASHFHNDGIKQRLEKFSIIFEDVYSRSKIQTRYYALYYYTLEKIFGKVNYLHMNYSEKLDDDTFFTWLETFNEIAPNVTNVEKLGMPHKIFGNNLQFPLGKKLPFKLSNKYVAYIGDIQYYKGGDFEYAQWGALNNSIFANYVINNKHEFPDFVIKNAVSNMLINGIIDEELVNKYKPFYFFNFHSLHMHERSTQINFTADPEYPDCSWYPDLLMKKFPSLKVNAAFAYLQRVDIHLCISIHEYPEILTDIDIISIMRSIEDGFECVDNHINQARDQGYYYQHLDFENECTYDEPKKIPFDSVNLDEWINTPLKVFKEGLNITEFASITANDPASLTGFSKLQI